MRTKPPDDIRVPSKSDLDTWNDCPNCGKTWQTIPAIPGLIHRTVLCKECQAKKRNT